MQVLQNNRDLRAEYDSLSKITTSYADILKREADEKQRITDATNNYLQSVTDDIATRQAVIKAQNDITDNAKDHADKLAQIQQDEQAKEIEDRTKAASQAEDDTAKHLQKIQDIEDQYAMDHEAAVGNRDALANYKAKQTEDKALSKEEAQYSEQERTLQKHLDEQLTSERVAERKSELSENSSYTKRYNQLVSALNEAQVAESRSQGLMLAYQNQANSNRQVAEFTHQYNMAVIQQNGLTALENGYRQHLSNLANIVAGAAYSPGQTSSSLLGNPIFNRAVDSRVNTMLGQALHIP
jgi:DNA repair exonuclease SbcCD ATPase subunit